jgi:hypothetical protein
MQLLQILNMEKQPKYKVDNPRSLKAWQPIARKEIYRWLTDENYQNEVSATTMTKEDMGPFTKFLYHFASLCECGWGVMVDFNEYRQRVFLSDHYYRWMHEILDKMLVEMEKIEELKQK